jgi:sugar phosphate isomerase/epimerase
VSALGGRFLLVSGHFDKLEACREAARILDEAGRRCRDSGVTLCYHNHAWEFGKLDGARPIDLLIAESDPELVKLCPDVYWVHVGGDVPAQFIARHRDRCPYFHFKDGLGGERSRAFRELGRGCVDVKAALEAALACNPEWIVTEQDHTDGDPGDSIRISRECLKSLGLL